MVDLSAIPTNVNSISNIILVNPQKNVGIQAQMPPGQSGKNEPKGFLFHITGEESVTLNSDITDHFAENNSALQDQIALKPEVFTTEGYIGELNNVPPDFLIPLKVAADKLTMLSPFLPAISSAAQIAYNNADQAYRVAKLALGAAVSAWGSITGTSGDNPVQNEQQKAFNMFYGYYLNRQLFTVQTPWNIFTDMAILTLRASQDAETRVITGFSVTFKKMRFAQSIVSIPISQGRGEAQSSDFQDKGISKPVEDIGLSDQFAASGLA